MTFQSVTIKSTPWRISLLAQLKREGKMLLPDLQRGFVWSPDRVRALLDSLYRRYPVGALLFWKPTWSGEPPFVTRAWDLTAPDESGLGVPEEAPKVVPGAYFVLDGQQRMTSLFRVILKSLHRGTAALDPDLYVALSPEPEWVESPFHLATRQLNSQRRAGLLVPAHVLFESLRSGDRGSDSLAVQNALRDWVTPESPVFFEALDRANAIRSAVLGAEIVAYEIDADAEDDNVIEIFARLNQQGVRLRPGDLAAARLTGVMKNFRERARQALGSPLLMGFAAQEGGEEEARSGSYVDTDLIVRTAMFLSSGVLRYRDVERRGKGAEQAYVRIEEQWDAAVRGLTAAVTMFRQAGVPDGSWLPYRYLLLMPAVAEARGHGLKLTQWLGWAVAASMWSHYGSSSEARAQADAKCAAEGDLLGLFENLKASARRGETLLPEVEDFTHNVPHEPGVLLAMLVYLTRTKAGSLPSGRPLAVRNQGGVKAFHLFPREALDQLGWRDGSTSPDRIGNLAIGFSSDAEAVAGKLPREYLAAVGADVLAQHGVPPAKPMWELPRYAEFCRHREAVLAREVLDLLRSYGVS